MIVSSGPHVAPLEPAVSSVARVTAGPPVTATFFNTPRPSTNPIHWPSGETNGPRGAPVNTATGSRASSARTKICVPLVADVDEAGAVRRDRQVAVVPVDGQRGGPAGVSCRRETRGGTGSAGARGDHARR